MEPLKDAGIARGKLGCSIAATSYLARLSAASITSLALQGGPMTAADAQGFFAQPHARRAVLLPHAEDAAKVCGLQVLGLDAYHRFVASLWR